MKKTHYIVLLVIIAQAALLMFLYNAKFDSGSGMLVGLTDSRKNRENTILEQRENVSRVKYRSNIEKYVDSVNKKVHAFQEDDNFKKMSLGKKRIKLVEYFTLHIADPDYALLNETEQKQIMNEFLRRYMPEK